jgi:hypothetical protein
LYLEGNADSSLNELPFLAKTISGYQDIRMREINLKVNRFLLCEVPQETSIQELLAKVDQKACALQALFVATDLEAAKAAVI